MAGREMMRAAVVHEFGQPLEEVDAIFDRMQANPLDGRVVLDMAA